MAASKLRVCIAGGGNAAHILVGLLASRGHAVNIFAPFADESEKWAAAHDAGITVHLPGGQDVHGRFDRVSKRAEDVIPDADLTLLPIPAFAVPSTLESIAAHLKPNSVVGALPGSGGFHFAADRIIHQRHKRNDVVLFGSNQLPLNCRFIEYARDALCLSIKKSVHVATMPAESIGAVTSMLNDVLAPIHFDSLPHMIAACLYPANNVIHPSRLYDEFEHWQKGQVYDEPPLFYAAFSERTIGIADKLSKELCGLAHAVDRASAAAGCDAPRIGDSVLHIHDAMKIYYGDIIEDRGEDFLNCFTKNYGYTGLKMPMHTREDGKLEPDFKHRYFTEDIPNGLCLAKGVADIVGEEVPLITRVIEWAQGHMGKEYVAGGKLVGKDVGETGAPQRYGITCVQDLMEGVVHADP